MKKQINDLKTKEVKSKCSKRAWAIFSFFSSTNVETKNVCPIAYNASGVNVRFKKGDMKNEIMNKQERLLEAQMFEQGQSPFFKLAFNPPVIFSFLFFNFLGRERKKIIFEFENSLSV